MRPHYGASSGAQTRKRPLLFSYGLPANLEAQLLNRDGHPDVLPPAGDSTRTCQHLDAALFLVAPRQRQGRVSAAKLS